MTDASDAANRAHNLIERLRAASVLWPAPERAAIEPPLEEAARALYEWAARPEGHDDPLGPLDRAIALTRSAREAAQGLRSRERAAASIASLEQLLSRERERAIDRIVATQSTWLRRAPSAAQAAGGEPPFEVSDGVPRLRTVRRAPLVPTFEPPPPSDDEPPRDLAALLRLAEVDDDDEALPLAPDPSPASPEQRELSALARELMMELAGLSLLRRRNEGEPWPAPRRFEERLLEMLDALFSLAVTEPGAVRMEDLLREALAFCNESLSDTGRAHVRGLVLGSVGGRDVARALARSLADVSVYAEGALTLALALAPATELSGELVGLARERDARVASLALRVVAQRGDGAPSELGMLLVHPSDDVVEAACAALAASRVDAKAASEMLEEVTEDRAGTGAGAAAALGLLRLGNPLGLAYARRWLADDASGSGEHRAACARLLALGGSSLDRDLLFGRLFEPEGARDIGIHGSPEAVPHLLAALLEANVFRDTTGARLPSDEEHAIASALRRLTGLALPSRPELGWGPLSTDAHEWTRAVEAMSPGLPRSGRVRRGRPFHPLAVLDDALDPTTGLADRAVVALELSILTRNASRFVPHDWVTRQESELAAVAELLKSPALRFEPGFSVDDWLRGGR